MLFGAQQQTNGVVRIVNMHKRAKRAVDPRKLPDVDVFIGRGSVLGNEYHIGVDGTRDEVCEKYDVKLKRKLKRKDPVIVAEITRIVTLLKKGHDVNLVCYCAPDRCHGESVQEVVRKQHGGRKPKTTGT